MPFSKVYILGTKVDCVQIPDVTVMMEDWINKKEFHHYIVTSNAYNVTLGAREPGVMAAANNSSLSVPDGFSLVMAARLYGQRLKKRVYGPDLMLDFLKISEIKGYSNFFYGSTDRTLKLLVKGLKTRFPRLKIAGYYSPPFNASLQLEEKEMAMINNSAADVVWVGLGGVKQERWMYKYKDKLNVPVLVGVGAAFDFLAGLKPQAPRWIGNIGFEWLFRLISEPNRLWRRYLITNCLFVYYVGNELAAKTFSFLKRQTKENL